MSEDAQRAVTSTRCPVNVRSPYSTAQLGKCRGGEKEKVKVKDTGKNE